MEQLTLERKVKEGFLGRQKGNSTLKDKKAAIRTGRRHGSGRPFGVRQGATRAGCEVRFFFTITFQHTLPT